ncbi:ABC transporter substrate-binding protein [Nonomuraea salmonea]|uniref:ABC transporter substrate-binding protein n=1 Tax=Nonomuraea salmonea TaxID=46181 RepID=UPI002FEC4811
MITSGKGGARRQAVKGLALAGALSLALAACGSGDPEPADPNGKITLSVTVWNLAKTPEFKALFDAFQQANPNITIKPVDILADDYPDKVTTMLAGGDKTDVITMKNVIDYSRYSSRNQLLELTDLVKSTDTSKLAGLDAFDVSGKYYALPYRQDFWLLYYNKTLLDKAGAKLPDPLTWDDYTKLAKELTQGEGGDKVYGAYHHTWRSVVQAISAAQTGGDQLSGDYTFFTDQYNVAKGLQDAGAVLDFGTAKSQQADYRSQFESGKTALMPMGTWYISGILEAKAKGATDVEWGARPHAAASRNDRRHHVRLADRVRRQQALGARRRGQEVRRVRREQGGGAEAITKVGVVPALQTPEITEAYFGLEGMPEDELSKKAFVPDKVTLEMPVSENSSDIDTILNEEHELIMVNDKSVADGIRTMNERVKSEVLN